MMKLRLVQPEVLIDINGLAGLSYITLEGGTLRIGALARHAELLASDVAGDRFAILHDAERVIADPVVREWGTIGGSLCQADPSEDLSAAFAAMKGSMVISGPEGTREVGAREFHTGPYETVVSPAEILTEIRLPVHPGGGSAYVKVSRRAGDWPVGAAGAAVWLSDGGKASGKGAGKGPGNRGGENASQRTIRDAGIGLTALGATHFVAAEAEDFLLGQPPTDEVLTRAGEIAAAHCRPVTDQRGPADYKRHLAQTLTTRVLRLAVSRAEAQIGPAPMGQAPPGQAPMGQL
jgi:carbon-monoxide dehydrogenase medium subunit